MVASKGLSEGLAAPVFLYAVLKLLQALPLTFLSSFILVMLSKRRYILVKRMACILMINLFLQKIFLITYFVSKFLYLERLFLFSRQFSNDAEIANINTVEVVYFTDSFGPRVLNTCSHLIFFFRAITKKLLLCLQERESLRAVDKQHIKEHLM